MKKTILILALAALMLSCNCCTKKWECEVTTTTSGMTSTHTTEFEGTTQEKNDFEASAINSDLTTQTIECH